MLKITCEVSLVLTGLSVALEWFGPDCVKRCAEVAGPLDLAGGSIFLSEESDTARDLASQLWDFFHMHLGM